MNTEINANMNTDEDEVLMIGLNPFVILNQFLPDGDEESVIGKPDYQIIRNVIEKTKQTYKDQSWFEAFLNPTTDNFKKIFEQIHRENHLCCDRCGIRKEGKRYLITKRTVDDVLEAAMFYQATEFYFREQTVTVKEVGENHFKELFKLCLTLMTDTTEEPMGYTLCEDCFNNREELCFDV